MAERLACCLEEAPGPLISPLPLQLPWPLALDAGRGLLDESLEKVRHSWRLLGHLISAACLESSAMGPRQPMEGLSGLGRGHHPIFPLLGFSFSELVRAETRTREPRPQCPSTLLPGKKGAQGLEEERISTLWGSAPKQTYF